MANSPMQEHHWPEPAASRVPYWVYTDQAIFDREMERFFAGPTWNYVALSCEIPEPGDWRRNWIGNRQVIVVRDEDATVKVIENLCAHRGARVVWTDRGKAESFTCPYHQWCYDLDGSLNGVPLRRGVQGKGGMPKDFKTTDHRMRPLCVTERGGVIWASFDPDVPDFESYCGPDVLPVIDRQFNGRPFRLLGYQRQLIPGNWKMIFENVKDPYHATLLHSFYITFGLWRADNETRIYSSNDGRHGVLISRNTGKQTSEVTQELNRFRDDLVLQDMSVVTPVTEFEDGNIAGVTFFPSIITQQQANSLAVRHVIPKSPGSFELAWTFYGYADDDAEMTQRRLRHANLVGPSGLVSIDDSEVIKQCQQAAISFPDRAALLELGGRGTEAADHMITEASIRAFYGFYRKAMDL